MLDLFLKLREYHYYHIKNFNLIRVTSWWGISVFDLVTANNSVENKKITAPLQNFIIEMYILKARFRSSCGTFPTTNTRTVNGPMIKMSLTFYYCVRWSYPLFCYSINLCNTPSKTGNFWVPFVAISPTVRETSIMV